MSGILAKWHLIWKRRCIIEYFYTEKVHSLTLIDAYSAFTDPKLWIWIQFRGEWLISAIAPAVWLIVLHTHLNSQNEEHLSQLMHANRAGKRTTLFFYVNVAFIDAMKKWAVLLSLSSIIYDSRFRVLSGVHTVGEVYLLSVSTVEGVSPHPPQKWCPVYNI